MQTFIDILVSLFAALVATILAQLGLNVDQRASESREVHRTVDCPSGPSATVSTANRDC
jgi:hypothetical protein